MLATMMRRQSAVAVRMQRSYRRQKQGLAVFSVELNEAALAEELIVGNFLRPADADNRKAISQALQAAVTAMIERGDQ